MKLGSNSRVCTVCGEIRGPGGHSKCSKLVQGQNKNKVRNKANKKISLSKLDKYADFVNKEY